MARHMVTGSRIEKARLPGETRVEQCRRLGTYEFLREDFERWFLDEERTTPWVAAKIERSVGLVQQIRVALDIQLPPTSARTRDRSRRTDHHVSARTLPATLAEWRRQELDDQRMRLTYCSAWDRGW